MSLNNPRSHIHEWRVAKKISWWIQDVGQNSYMAFFLLWEGTGRAVSIDCENRSYPVCVHLLGTKEGIFPRLHIFPFNCTHSHTGKFFNLGPLIDKYVVVATDGCATLSRYLDIRALAALWQHYRKKYIFLVIRQDCPLRQISWLFCKILFFLCHLKGIQYLSCIRNIGKA